MSVPCVRFHRQRTPRSRISIIDFYFQYYVRAHDSSIAKQAAEIKSRLNQRYRAECIIAGYISVVNYPEVAVGCHQPRAGSYTPDEIDHRDILSISGVSSLVRDVTSSFGIIARDAEIHLEDEKRP